MKEKTVRMIMTFREMWYDWLRWGLLLYLVYVVMSTLILVYFNMIEYFFGLNLFMGLIVCFAVTWVLMFFTEPENPHFRGDD